MKLKKLQKWGFFAAMSYLTFQYIHVSLIKEVLKFKPFWCNTPGDIDMPNASKVKDRRWWKKWYASGAVKQQALSAENLVMKGICTFFDKNGTPTHETLFLGKNHEGGGWSLVVGVVVPFHPKHEKWLHTALDKIPNNAVPCDVYYGPRSGPDYD